MAWASYKRLTSRRQWGFAAARDGDGEAAKSRVLIHAIHGRELQRTAYSIQKQWRRPSRGFLFLVVSAGVLVSVTMSQKRSIRHECCTVSP